MKNPEIPLLELRKIQKSYSEGEQRLLVLRGICLAVYPGDFVAILGKSGSGKTTLLQIMAGIQAPDEGEVRTEGKTIGRGERARSSYRRLQVGLIQQDYGLMEELTVLENVELAIKMVRGRQDPRRMLERFGLIEKQNRYPRSLSGGEKQRTAIARALAKEPRILLCDEPTGALDRISGEMVMKELLQASLQGQTVVLITHDQEHAQLASHIYKLEDGRLEKWEKS